MYTPISLVSAYSNAFALNSIQGRDTPVLPQTKRKISRTGVPWVLRKSTDARPTPNWV